MADAHWKGSSTPYLSDGQGDVWQQEAAALGRSGTQRITWAGETEAPEEIRAALGLAAGSGVIARQRLILLDEQPIELANSYWPSNVAGGTNLAQPRKIRGGAVSLLADLGYRPASVDEQIRTRPPTEEEMRALELTDAHEWVLTLTRVIANDHGRPYEVSVMVNPGRIGRLHYSMKVD
jgi:DNA-binding GntR family transcriptional regulator